MKQHQPRRQARPSSTDRTDPTANSVPNVVATAFDSPGKMLAALRPYRDREEVRDHMDAILREAA